MDAIKYIELHYHLSDNSHSMNAFVFNKCEHEILGVLNEIASKLGYYPQIEIEPIENGGVRSWFKLKQENATIQDVFFVTVLAAVVANFFSAPIQEIAKTTVGTIVDKLLEDPEIRELKKEREKLQLQFDIQELKEKLENKIDSVDIGLIKKKRSNFYESMLQTPKIENFTLSLENAQRDVTATYSVSRERFSNFVLSTNQLDPLIDEHAVIEIISPVLKRGKYKWSGIYQETPIHFAMNSREFKNSVEIGAVSFKNGSFIDCRLISHRKMDEDGCAQITKHEVDLVNSFIENGVATETPEGRKNRLDQKAKKDQLNFLNELK